MLLDPRFLPDQGPYSRSSHRLHEKQRHVSELKFRLFFVVAEDPFHNLRFVFGMLYCPVKSQFFGIFMRPLRMTHDMAYVIKGLSAIAYPLIC